MRAAAAFKNLIFICLLPVVLLSREIETFYGTMDVQEQVLLDLIDSSPFQRLKSIHQYGVAYYTTHQEEYNRYDHSIGVFAILRAKGCSLEEQIAGLLHDVSHTVFSHVGDWVFGKEGCEKDYQNDIHAYFLENSGLADILKKYRLTADEILPLESLFPALENSLPDLCADRIDYNIQGAFYQGFITREEAQAIFSSLRFIDNRWISSEKELMKKLTKFSLFMTQDCWGSARNYMTSRWLADALLRAIELEEISYDDLHFGTDQEIWDRLIHDNDPFIQKKMKMILNATDYFHLVSPLEADFCVKSKFRGIDPWIETGSDCIRLTSMDNTLKKEFENVKELMRGGWHIKLEGL